MSFQTLAGSGRIGCFGKLPTSGDFLRRGLPQPVYDGWDRWLQQALMASREALGERWLDHYLVAPVWRFALAPGLLSEEGWLGLWLPSVDSVGRYFPFTVLAPVPEGTGLCRAADHAAGWYEDTERHLHDLLQQQLGLDEAEQCWQKGWPGSWSPFDNPEGESWAVETARPGSDPVPGWPALIDVLLARQQFPASLWWHNRRDGQTGVVLVSRGLPRPYACTALLDGQWRRWSWEFL